MSVGTFAVVDVETTGLSPQHHHRVAEIAVVKVDRSGGVIDRWETLVNPGRDLGPQEIHGIRAAEILDAPPFAALVPTLSRFLTGSVLVAHNLSFDSRFLDHEFRSAGAALPVGFLNGLCTMRLAHTYLPGAARALRDCCDSFGIETGRVHSAGDDAFAAAQLLGRYIDLDPELHLWDDYLGSAAKRKWRSYEEAQPMVPVLRRPVDLVEPHFLARISERLPEYSGPDEHEQYLALLDRALLDRHLSTTEGSALVDLAHDLGISSQTVRNLHQDYVHALLEAAWGDGVITDDEEHDLRLVAKLLDVPQELVAASLDSRPATPGKEIHRHAGLEPGDTIVLTGEMQRSRSELEQMIEHAGYKTHSGVTKKVNLVVAADPDTLSGKARKARGYGIPVVSEDYLLQIIGV
jgi:DNA polymerase-3 subunit epsilon